MQKRNPIAGALRHFRQQVREDKRHAKAKGKTEREAIERELRDNE